MNLRSVGGFQNHFSQKESSCCNYARRIKDVRKEWQYNQLVQVEEKAHPNSHDSRSQERIEDDLEVSPVVGHSATNLGLKSIKAWWISNRPTKSGYLVIAF